MGLGDVTGVFSRYFVVGFFLPAYASLLALWLAATPTFVPDVLDSHGQATQVAVLGTGALGAALLLSGTSFYVLRAFEGYPLQRFPLLLGVAVALQRRRFDRLVRTRDDEAQTAAARSRAAWMLDRYFPHDRSALLPTRLGNAFRAFERHSNGRWGLDGVTAWPRIDSLLASDERELHVDAKIDLYVFVNAALGAFVVGVCLVVDRAADAATPLWKWSLLLIPFAAGYGLYRAAVDPAVRWGDAVRSSIDIHRLELYEKLGVRAPTSFSDERAIAACVNAALLYGHPLLRDELWRNAESNRERTS